MSDLREMAAELRVLLADHDAIEDRVSEAFEQGYRLGFAAGDEVGYGRARVEQAADWERLAAYVRAYAKTPTHVELVGRRAAIGPRGREVDYRGGPVDWETRRHSGRGVVA